MTDEADELTTTQENRAIEKFVRRWAAILGLAVLVGTICIPVAVFAITLRRDVDLQARQIEILSANADDSRDAFRLTCAMATPAQEEAAGVTSCSDPYRNRHR